MIAGGCLPASERLADFYADVHLRKLLAYNPEWVWTQIETVPLQDGFLNK